MDERERLNQRVGKTLGGKWTLERLLGVGGMAAVYVGVHKIGRRAAIKILHPDIAENKQLARRFEQEAHAVNSFRHPGAVEILDIDVTEDGAPFLVMELLEGEPLADRVNRSAVTGPELLQLMDELLDVLAAAHAHGIIHRDIKPDNLFALRDGHLKVLDFGIAQMRKGAPQSVYTAIGTTIGTLTYMSPEQVAGKEIDGRADIFAVGCTMFRIVSGRSPHHGDTDLELMVKMAMEPAPPLASLAPGASPELCMVVDRALAFERDRRYPDARTMQEDVRALRHGARPPYAASRLAAGDWPNPAGTGPASAAAVSVRSGSSASLAGAWSPPPMNNGAAYAATAMGVMPSAGTSGAWGPPSASAPLSNPNPSPTAMRYGLTMPGTGAPPGRPMAMSAPALSTPMPGAPPSALHAPLDRQAKDKRTALLLIGAMLLVGIGVLALWLVLRPPGGSDPTLASDARTPGGADSAGSAGREPRGKSSKPGGKRSPRSSPTVIVIPISPNGEPLPGHYAHEEED